MKVSLWRAAAHRFLYALVSEGALQPLYTARLAGAFDPRSSQQGHK
jgi:hypothetical protein